VSGKWLSKHVKMTMSSETDTCYFPVYH